MTLADIDVYEALCKAATQDMMVHVLTIQQSLIHPAEPLAEMISLQHSVPEYLLVLSHNIPRRATVGGAARLDLRRVRTPRKHLADCRYFESAFILQAEKLSIVVWQLSSKGYEWQTDRRWSRVRSPDPLMRVVDRYVAVRYQQTNYECKHAAALEP
ncbi:hypothetical protein EVAR_67902_1 [Eumeta japonica]|uniref:Uncharacterized protein n=1 Tax=Eumeta variegata TaxID=151549 RepID=A0A4C1YXU0_EUMVA|nr:hypothetical protein EVAR_67902_1 [Eumeta japonica]